MRPVCKVEFSGLTPEQHIRLMQAYAEIISVTDENGNMFTSAAATFKGAADADTPFVPNVPGRAPVGWPSGSDVGALPPVPQQPQAPVVQPPVTTQAPVTNGQVAPGAVKDAFGVPYNPAIHSITTGPSGGRNQDGSWKMKKNVSRDEYNAWNTRHRTAANAPTPPAAIPTPDQVNAQFGAPPVTNGDPFAGNPPAVQPNPSVQPGVAFGGQSNGFGSTLAAAPAVDYATFVAKCNELVVKQLMGDETVARVKLEVGCADEKLINNDPDIRARAYQVLLQVEREALVDA